jgi:hypothetical protein
VSTQHELTERDQEIGRMENEIIKAWVASGGKLPQDTFTALLTGAKIACEQTDGAAADRALNRLRRAVEGVRS